MEECWSIGLNGQRAKGKEQRAEVMEHRAEGIAQQGEEGLWVAGRSIDKCRMANVWNLELRNMWNDE